MKQESANLTARESLDIIASMIQVAKGNVQRNTFFFLFWGWVVVIANLGMFALLQLGYAHFYAIWLITIPAWGVTIYKAYTSANLQPTRTHFDRITAWLWITYGISIFFIVCFGYRINYQINPLVLIISAVPTIVSGVILNFTPLKFGGVAFWIGGTVCFLLSREMQPLAGAVAILLGFLVPGYMLKSKKD